jgi:hypothetical protein
MSRQSTELDEALHLLEEELRAMVPADPSDGLRARVFHALSTADGLDGEADPVFAGAEETKLEPVGRAWFGWVPVAAAAAVALMAVVIFPPKAAHSPGLADAKAAAAAPAPQAITAASETTPVDWQPMSSDSRLEQVAYDGVRQEETSTYRQIRTRYLDRRTFRNPHDGSTVEVMLPREEIRLVPVVPE